MQTSGKDRTDSSHRRPERAAVITIRVIGLYVLAGALGKAFWGAPSDLPAVLLRAAPGRAEEMFLSAVGAELFAAVVALIAPRAGFWPLGCLMLAFITVLLGQSGELGAPCGCFGAVAIVPAWVILCVDALALAGLFVMQYSGSLCGQPWRPWGLAAGVLVAAAGVVYVRADAAHAGDWRSPDTLPRFAVLHPPDWVGKPLRRTGLARWVDTSEFPEDATLILYFETCQQCATHLRELAEDPGGTDYVLIQLPTPPRSRQPIRVKKLPDGMHLTLPGQVRWQVRTPWDVIVEDGKVVEVVKGFE
ncbi:MAG: hypothetical protein JSV91_06205 [Phycisphaerales bacterium]|nr:MAG: hypothetical protein JSV91_06205 [Phycisphaerales bacterium]